MIIALIVIVALMAVALIGMQRELDNVRDVLDQMTSAHKTATRLFDATNKRLKTLELAQQEQLDRIVDLTANVAQKQGDLKRWTYKNVNDIWYAIENPLTGKEEESEEVRS